MAFISIKTDNDSRVENVLKNIIFKSQEENLVKNPFKIRAEIFKGRQEIFFLMDISPIYPPVFWFGVLALFPFIVFGWFNWFLLIPGAFLSIGFLWSFPFYFILLRAALRKKGYKGKIELVSKKETIRRLLKWGK